MCGRWQWRRRLLHSHVDGRRAGRRLRRRRITVRRRRLLVRVDARDAEALTRVGHWVDVHARDRHLGRVLDLVSSNGLVLCLGLLAITTATAVQLRVILRRRKESGDRRRRHHLQIVVLTDVRDNVESCLHVLCREARNEIVDDDERAHLDRHRNVTPPRLRLSHFRLLLLRDVDRCR